MWQRSLSRQPLAIFLGMAAAVSFACEQDNGRKPGTGGSGGAGTGNGGSGTGGTGGTGTGGTSGTGGGGAGRGGTGGGGSGGTSSDARPGDGGGTTGDGGGTTGDGGGTTGDGGSAMPTPDGDYGWTKKPVPVLWISLAGNVGAEGIAKPGLPKSMRTLGTVKVIENHDGTPVTDVTGKPVALEAPVLMEGRGSSSYGLLGNPPFNGQRGYGLEFHDGQRNSVGKVLLGMPQNADWALVPCFTDKTCLRNALTYAAGREINSTARWTARFRWAEVYIDGKYWGVYTVTEKVKDDKFRVNLPKAPAGAPPEEHAYMFSGNGDYRSAPNKMAPDGGLPPGEFWDVRGSTMTRLPTVPSMPGDGGKRRWKWREPNFDTTTKEQQDYLKKSFEDLQLALEMGSANWKNLIDIPSWIDYFVVSEFTNNVDSFFKSWYLYKLPQSMGGKWFMGLLWDYDLAYGNANYHMRYCTSNTRIGPLAKLPPPAALAQDFDLPPPAWVTKPLADTAIRNDLRCRWNEVRKSMGPLDIAILEAKIDQFAAHIKPVIPRHTERWKNVGRYVWPNNYVGATWENEISYLKHWIRKRLAWVDRSLPGMCAMQPAPGAVMQSTLPPSMMVPRPAAWNGEEASHHSEFIDPAATMPAAWACPQ